MHSRQCAGVFAVVKIAIVTLVASCRAGVVTLVVHHHRHCHCFDLAAFKMVCTVFCVGRLILLAQTHTNHMVS